MRRREFLAGALAFLPMQMSLDAMAAFPFERIETTGEQGLATWEQLKSAGRGSPVILGDDESVAGIMDSYPSRPNKGAVAKILAAADGIEHPKDLVSHRQEEEESEPPPIGKWPTDVSMSIGPSAVVDITTDKPLDKVHIALIPTDDWTTIPAYLHWGGWNACPDPAFHVAALRSWRDRFGAELVGLGHDTMDLRVIRRPQTREAALELAREQYAYCNDIVDQGTGTLSALAASLKADPWWFFWWD